MTLPLKADFAPMEALRSENLPVGPEWQYEPKWDGFRALVFKDGRTVLLQSKSGTPLARYFPELVEEVRKLKPKRFVLDAEIVLLLQGQVSFDGLQLRLHPAASRIARLSQETPANLMCFDLLYANGRSLITKPLRERRKKLENFFKAVPESSALKLCPATRDAQKAREWFHHFSSLGLDGVMAKDLGEPYHSGDRQAMVKVKQLKSADCVVAGYRLQSNGQAVAALTLGLYDEKGLLHHVGSTSSFTAKERKDLLKKLRPLEGGPGFTGTAPGQSRWSKDENTWIPLKPRLVCEVRYDYFTAGRFRHGTKFLRWRPDKAPRLCTYEQLRVRSVPPQGRPHAFVSR